MGLLSFLAGGFLLGHRSRKQRKQLIDTMERRSKAEQNRGFSQQLLAAAKREPNPEREDATQDHPAAHGDRK